MDMVTAECYAGVKDRHQANNVVTVKCSLEKVIHASPTTITPRDRSELIKTILHDLRDEPGAAWRSWPADIVVIALQAVKILGRNPIGSECIAEKRQLQTILFHSNLISGTSSPSPKSTANRSASPAPFTRRSSSLSRTSLSPIQTEAISTIANTLTLHPVLARSNVLDLGGGRGALRLLEDAAKCDVENGKGKSVEKENNDGSSLEEMIFLLCRVLFLLTVKPGRLVVEFVDETDGVGALVQILQSIRLAPPNYKAIAEVLKVVYNVIVHYNPSTGRQAKPDPDEEWNEAFDGLLEPILSIVYSIQQIDILPPLTNAIYALTLFPFNSKLTPIWLSTPTSYYSQPSPSSPDKRSQSTKRRSLYQLFSFGSSAGQTASTSNTSLSPTSAGVPQGATGGSPRSSYDSSGSESGGLPTVVQKVLQALNNFLSSNLPALPLTPDDDLPLKAKGLVMDEVLPPVFGLMTRMAMGSETLKDQFRTELLPDSLDRSPGSTPLENRATLLGHLLRFLRSTTHPHSQQTLDHFFWAMSGNDANSLVNDIGYGNAAGLLFRRGITAPSQQDRRTSAHVEEISDDDEAEQVQRPTGESVKTPPSPPRRKSPKSRDQTRDPITALKPDTLPVLSPLSGMTDEEKEREAERLFVLFDRMDKNPAMKMMENPMHAAVARGDTEKWEAEDAKKEIEEVERQEQIDEQEALKEITTWKQRMGRK